MTDAATDAATGAAARARAGLPTTKFGLWVHGARPYSLVISIAPIVLGIGYAWGVAGRLAIWPVLAATLSALAIQIATNLANDAADGTSGVDHPDRPGPPRLTGSGILSAREVRLAALVATMAAGAFGLVAVLAGGWPILAIGVASIVAGWGYSAGPRPISGTPLGEVFVAVFFGVLAVVGTVWLAAGRSGWDVALLGLGIGLPAAAVLTVNNHRDRVQDAISGRSTLAIRIGAARTIQLYGAQMIAASLLVAAALWPYTRPGAALIGATALIGAWMTRRLAATPIGLEASRRLAETAQFQMALAALAAILLVIRP